MKQEAYQAGFNHTHDRLTELGDAYVSGADDALSQQGLDSSRTAPVFYSGDLVVLGTESQGATEIVRASLQTVISVQACSLFVLLGLLFYSSTQYQKCVHLAAEAGQPASVCAAEIATPEPQEKEKEKEKKTKTETSIWSRLGSHTKAK